MLLSIQTMIRNFYSANSNANSSQPDFLNQIGRVFTYMYMSHS